MGVRTPVQHAMFGGYISVLTGLTEFVLSIIAGNFFFFFCRKLRAQCLPSRPEVVVVNLPAALS